LRRQAGGEILPDHMDIETLEANAAYARPLTQTDRRNLERLANRTELRDQRPVIAHLLRRGLKLEQEAIPVNG
jgi:hypothetical protein